MSDPVRVAILGFSAFERSAMASYFNLASRRTPGYQCVLEADQAHFIVADADHAGTLTLLRALGRVGDAVFVGAQGPADGAAWMMRPINPVHVLRELDAMLLQRTRPHSAPLPLALPAGPVAQAEALASAAPSRRAGDDPARDQRRHEAEARRRLRAAATRPQVLRRALLVDDSDIALHFLRRQLEPYGLACDVARHSDRALDLLTHHGYGLVFVDVDLGEHSASDGLTLCQTIKHRLVLPGGRPPLVAMVSAFHDPVHQVRGTLAGADAYLGKPLDFAALDQLLQTQGLSRAEPADVPQTPPPEPPAGVVERRSGGRPGRR